MEGPQEAVKTTNGVSQNTIVEEETLVDLSTPQKMVEETPSTPDSAAKARRVTRSQTTGRPTIRWGKYGREDDGEGEPQPQQPQQQQQQQQQQDQRASSALKRTFDARAVDNDTDVEPDQDSTYQPSKMIKMEPTILISAPASVTDAEEQPPMVEAPATISRASPASGEYTFLDASSSSFTAERRGPRIRTAPPVPVPNLTKKSRGRRVPTAEDTVTESEPAEGKKGRVYICKVQDCGKCFSRGEHLKRHIRSIHTHEKPFQCPHPACDKRFNRNDNLLQHLRVHKGDSSSQTSVDSAPGPAGEELPVEEGSSSAMAPQRTSTKTTNTARRATRPLRKTKSAASTPPIPAARLAALRMPGRGLPLPLPRTYSMPPLPSLAPSYHSPAAAGFMNNTNIAVSSLRTAIDESDGEPETDTDVEARGASGYDLRSLYSFSRGLGKQTFRDPAYAVRESGHSQERIGDVMGEGSFSNARGERVINHETIQAKSEPASSPNPGSSGSRAATEEPGERLAGALSAAPSPPPSAVSAH